MEVQFREVQPMNRVAWVMFFVVALAALMWYTLIVQVVMGRPVGTSVGPDWMVVLFWLIFGVGFPLLFYFLRLEVIVDTAAIRINYPPLVKRDIALVDVIQCEAKRYNPLRDYGGWGVRGMLGKKRAYTTTGNEGVEITLRTGEQLMIGSQHPEILAQVINKARMRPIAGVIGRIG